LKYYGLIPARMESSRLPGKPLLDFWGIPMIIHVAKRAQLSKTLDDVIVCTDSYKIVNVCLDYEIPCCLTSDKCINGTERIAEASEIIGITQKDFIIDIQGDEPLINPDAIDNVANFLSSNDFDIVVPYIKSFGQEDLNRVKIVSSDNRILFMSRKNIPYPFTRDTDFKKHLSIIGFRVSALKKFHESGPTKLEEIESIELLRALEIGLKIGTFEEFGDSTSVDNQRDYEKALRLMKKDKIFEEYKT